jgi:large subunit ribosomal protein L37Ae
MARTKKTKASGTFGARYGTKVKYKWLEIEQKQRKKQKCPFCKKLSAKRIAKGIWECKSCKRKFAGDSYFLNI